jgi:hypothetical protein
LSKQLIPLYWIKMPTTLPSSAGMHRWIWDLRYTTPAATNYEYPISAVPHKTPREPQGPLALPGTYTVRLTADGKTLTAPLVVKIDPRVNSTSSDLESLFALQTKLAATLAASAEAALQAHSVREQIDKLTKGTQPIPPALKEALEKLDKQLGALLSGDESPSKPDGKPGIDDLAEGTSALYIQVGQADAAPTGAQQQAAGHAADELAEALPGWEKIKGSSIPEVNRQLLTAHLPQLNPEQKPESMPEGGDED